MHHIENTEHISAVIVMVILTLKKITALTAALEWTVVAIKTIYDIVEIFLDIVLLIGAIGCFVVTFYCILSLGGDIVKDYFIQDKTTEISQRIDDVVTELNTERNKISELTEENSKLKQEINMLKSSICRTNNFILFVLITYLIASFAKLVVILLDH